MALHLEVTRYGGLPPERPASLDLEAGACEIGRNPDNDLVLSDPERMVSGHHARIECRETGFWLTDRSTNGTFLNESRERLAPNQAVELHHGDRLQIGPYTIAVSIDSESAAINAGAVTSDQTGLPGMENPGAAADIMDLLGGGSGPVTKSGHTPVEDPFADAHALDPFLEGPAPEDHEHRPAAPRVTPVEHVHFRPPDTTPFPEEYDLLADALAPPPPGLAEPGPPDEAAGDADAETDWARGAEASEPSELSGPSELGETRDSDLAGPPSPHPRATQPESAAPLGSAPAPAAPSAPPETAQPPSDTGALAALLSGLGTGESGQVGEPQALFHDAGALLRALTAGLTTTMMARAQFKSELRLGVTTIRRSENNPFKFSTSPDEALERLLLRPNPAFLPALDAAREAFEDIQAHEMAMIAGLRAAMRALLARFEPSALEARLGNASGLDRLLPMARRSRYWELFNETYGQLAADAADDFMQLFGEAFARAYEDQILRLAQARRPGRGGAPP